LLLQYRVGDVGILEDAIRPGADAAAAGPAERAAARHPQDQPLGLDAAREDRIGLGLLRRRERRVFELGLERDFAGVGWRAVMADRWRIVGHERRMKRVLNAGISIELSARS